MPVLAAKQASVEAGIGGEERVAQELRKHTFTFEHHIFHDLSLTSINTFQMDHFFKTPYYGVILETKNIGGSLEFKDHPPQLIRTREDGHKDGFESPVVQLERNCELLTEWLKRRQIHLPIYGAVVLAYPKQIVSLPPAKTELLFPSMVPDFIKKLPVQGKKLDKDVFNWLSSELLNSHHFFIPKPISESYKIPIADFQPGVRCNRCGKIGMVKQPRTWYCPKCMMKDSLAHEREFLEWFLLFKRTITNKECRDFLMVDDIQVAKRMLQSMDWGFSGTFRNREYIMDFKNKRDFAIRQ